MDVHTRSDELDELDDDALMRLAADGTRAAFDQLVRRHQARALRAAKRYLGPAGDHMAADVAQEAFVEIFRRRQSYRAAGKFSAYLYRVLLSHCRMSGRRARRQPTVPLELHHEQHQSSRSIEDGETITLLAERQRELGRAIGKLSPKLREVVALRFGADLSYAEIGETLDVPLGTVKRRLFDAVEKLRKIVVSE